MTDNDILADMQRAALDKALVNFELFMSYAGLNSRFAIPGEADNALEALQEVYARQYGEDYAVA